MIPPVLAGSALPPDLLARAHGAAAALRDRGAGPDSRIAVGPSATGADATAWLLGADLLGAATLVESAAWAARERDAVLADAAPHVRVDGPPPETGDPVRPRPGDDSLFYLATTSGSSGRPKVLVRTRRSWRLGFDALGPLPGPVLLPGPAASSLYLFGALHGLYHGRGAHWGPLTTDAGTVHLVPALLGTLLDDHERRPRSGPRTVVCGGAHVGAALRERCARVLPDTTLIEYYGSAEHSLIAVRRGAGPLRPVSGVDVHIRDGELEVRSPQAFAGYLRGGTLDPAGAGHLGVGDRGTLTGDGGLVVHGRDSATISTGGTLVAAEEVEDVLRGVPGVADVVVGPTPHPRLGALVTAVLEARGTPPEAGVLRAAARDALSPAKRPRRWLVTSALPRLASGKPARAAVADGLADGTLPARPLPGTAPPSTGAACPAPDRAS